MCSSCLELAARVDIRTPGELQRALRVVRANLDDGTLVEVEGSGREVRFADIPLGGPWPDFLKCDFQCRKCGAAFSLAVETHHGAGGRWSVSEP